MVCGYTHLKFEFVRYTYLNDDVWVYPFPVFLTHDFRYTHRGSPARLCGVLRRCGGVRRRCGGGAAVCLLWPGFSRGTHLNRVLHCPIMAAADEGFESEPDSECSEDLDEQAQQEPDVSE